jgi:hypothetical protein
MINVYDPKNVGLLIDAENVFAILKDSEFKKYIGEILKLAEYFGDVVVSEAYGDWKMTSLSSKQKNLEAHGINCIQVDHIIKKNDADNRLMLRIGGLLVDNFQSDSPIPNLIILVSGDKDYVHACKLIREKGIKLIIIGISIANVLLEHCDAHYSGNELEQKLQELKGDYPIHPKELRQALERLRLLYRFKFNQFAWVHYEELEKALFEPKTETSKTYPLSQYLKCFTEEFEQRDGMIRPIDDNPESTRVSLLHTAYKQARQKWGDLVPRTEMDLYLRELANQFEPEMYKTYFGDKNLSELIPMYPEYMMEGEYVIRATLKSK